MTKHEFTGKTTEEAISEGLRKLGCTISDVKVEVLDEGAKGLFGLFGSKHARVLLTLDDDDDGFSALSSLSLDSFGDRQTTQSRGDKPAQSAKPTQPRTNKPVKQKPQDPVEPKATQAQQRSSKPAKQQPEKSTSLPTKPRVSSSEPSFQPIPLAEGVTPVLHDPSTPSGRAQQFLLEATKHMNVPVVVDVQTDPDGNLFAQMTGDTLGILIGRRGETLDALQYLTSLQVNKGSDTYTRVTLDTENYRAKREDSLRRLAARMATRAYKTGRKVSIEPMNPYERRILHASLQDHPYVVTHSEGEEPNRHVVITLKNETAAGQQSAPRIQN